MKAFIDIGGWTGVSTEFFLKNHPNGKEFKHFIFEPDKRHIETLKRKGLNVIPAAAGTYDGEVKYYWPISSTLAGGSIYSTKQTGGICETRFYKVKSVDIRRFIEQLKDIAKADYIVVKMNCEGAEYEIIPHIKDLKIDKYYIQWHWDKIGISKAKHDMVAAMIPWYPWEAQFKSERFRKEFIKTCDIF